MTVTYVQEILLSFDRIVFLIRAGRCFELLLKTLS